MITIGIINSTSEKEEYSIRTVKSALDRLGYTEYESVIYEDQEVKLVLTEEQATLFNLQLGKDKVFQEIIDHVMERTNAWLKP
jgi:hypothetical protein